jgi:hypothetical protein
VSALGQLFSDTASRGFRQAFAEVAPGQTDVFQFPIVELTQDSDIRRARPTRDFGRNPAVHEVTKTCRNEPEPLPDRCSGGFGVWSDIENCHRNFFRRLAIERGARTKVSNVPAIGGLAISDVEVAADQKMLALPRLNVGHSTTKDGLRPTGRDML